MIMTARIERISAPMKQHRVSPRNHAGDAYFAIGADGREWIVRDLLGSDQVLCEAIYWQLAPVVGASVAHGAVFEDEYGCVSWASLRVTPARHWAVGAGALVQNFDELGGMLALDATCCIQDRHPGNLLVTEREGRTVAVAIDNANALVGNAVDVESAVEACALPPLERHLHGLPLNLLDRPAMQAAARLGRIAAPELGTLVAEACGVTREPEIARITAALTRRLALATEVTSLHLRRLRMLP